MIISKLLKSIFINTQYYKNHHNVCNDEFRYFINLKILLKNFVEKDKSVRFNFFRFFYTHNNNPFFIKPRAKKLYRHPCNKLYTYLLKIRCIKGLITIINPGRFKLSPPRTCRRYLAVCIRCGTAPSISVHVFPTRGINGALREGNLMGEKAMDPWRFILPRGFTTRFRC